MVSQVYNRQSHPSVGKMLDSVNEAMHGFGFPEKMSLRSPIGTTTVSSDRCLGSDELGIIRDALQKTVDEKSTFKLFVGQPSLSIQEDPHEA